jgi:hypothetical protein
MESQAEEFKNNLSPTAMQNAEGMHKIDSITVAQPQWEKEGLLATGHHKYPIKSFFNGVNNEKDVKRRYTEIAYLCKLL